jgi:serine/threonine protein kinase
MPDLLGQIIGRYHLLEKLGEGGMAVVYKAFDTRLECEVAVKLIHTDRMKQETANTTVRRFAREAKAVAQLSHSNIVKVTDYGDHEGVPYLVMEYINGGTLKDKLGKPLPYQEAAKLLLPIARALQYAHSRKIIHRDVKPSNILISEAGELKLIDFGIAKVLDLEDGQTLTATGVGMGTPEYMAPEQWMGNITPSVDIYSLGAVLYELITGRKPFTGDTPPEVLIKTVNEPLPRPSLIVAGLPEQVENVLFKALAKKPENRFSSMDEFVHVLEDIARNDLKKLIRRETKTRRNGGNQSNLQRRTDRSIKSIALKTVYLCFIFGFIGFLVYLGNSNFPQQISESKSTTDLFFTQQISEPEKTISPSADETQINATLVTPTIEPVAATPTIDPESHVSEIPRVGKGIINEMVFSPDGKILAIASSIGIYFYSSDLSTEIGFIDTGNPVTDIAFSPDGSILASNISGSYDSSDSSSVWLWDVQTQKLVRTLIGHTDSVVSLIFSTQENQLVSTGYDRMIIWDYTKGTILNSFLSFDGSVSVTSLGISKDGLILACGTSDGRIWLRSTLNGVLIDSLGEKSWGSGFSFEKIVFSEDGKTLLVKPEGSLISWQLSNGYKIGSINNSVGLSDDGKYHFVISSNAIELWDVHKNMKVKNVNFLSDINTLILSPDHLLAAASYGDGSIRVYDINNNKQLGLQKEFTPISIFAISFTNNDTILATSNNQVIRFWKISTGEMLNSKEIQSVYNDYRPTISFSPSGKYFASWSLQDGIIQIWKTDGHLLRTIVSDQTRRFDNVRISTGETKIAAIAYGGEIHIWDFQTGIFLHTLGSRSSYGLDFSTDDKSLLSTGSSIRLWDLTSANLVFDIDANNSQSAIFAPDGKTFATTSTWSSSIDLWNVSSNLRTKTIGTGTRVSTSVLFSPDGGLFAVGCIDGSVLLIRTQDGMIIRTFAGQSKAISSLDFSSDGKLLASGSADGSVRLWEVPD